MAEMPSFQTWLSLLLLFPLIYGGSDVYVDPIASSCSDFNCTRDASALLVQNLTLDEALASISSQSTLHLRPGCHCIQSFNFVQNVSEVALVGEGPRSGVNITCAEGLGLAFYNLSSFSLRSVTVDGCGLTGSNLTTFRSRVENGIDLFFQIHSKYVIAFLCGNCTNLNVTSVTITNTGGLGFLGVNIMGTSVVHDSTFSSNAHPVPVDPSGTFNLSQVDQLGGGALFVYHDYLNDNTFHHNMANLSLECSNFSSNFYPGIASIIGEYYQASETIHNIGYLLGGGGGLTITMTQLNYCVSAFVDSCLFAENHARFGAGAHVEIFTGVSDSGVVFSDCLFEDNGDNGLNGQNLLDTTSGAALAFFKGFMQPGIENSHNLVPLQDNAYDLIIRRSVFRRNVGFTGGAITIYSLYAPQFAFESQMVSFHSCTFEDNSAFLGAVVYLQEEKRAGSQPGLYFLFENTTMTGNKVFTNNSDQAHSLDLADSSSIIDGYAVNMTIRDGYFANNTGTVLRTRLSLVHLEGNVTFFENTAAFGGALRVLSSSFLIVRNNSNITFLNNTAEIAGGAIFVQLDSFFPSVVYFDCFIFFDGLDLFCFTNISCVNISKTGARLNFIDNSAPFGSVVYGSTLETCPWGAEIRHFGNYSDLSLFEILYRNYSDVFNFDKAPNTTTQVSTGSSQVKVNSQAGPVNVTPGEEFLIDVVALDRFSREIPSVLASKIEGDGTNTRSILGLSGYWFTTNNTHTPVTVYGNGSVDNVIVTLFTIDSYAQADITVNLLKCTPTFIFEDYSCVCDPEVEKKSYIKCNSTSQELTVDNNLWVGYGPDGREVVSSHCVLDYCEPGSRTFRPPDFDVQCHSGYNRTGIACGECKEGYSIVFGTSKCKKCNYSGLYLIPVLGVLGFVIIFLICYLRISISDGFLLSILFYVNIVSLYTPSFSAGESQASIFIPTAWLNLDLGIETCFYDGMDAVARTGLQLVFPAYLYLLMCLIVILFRRSQRFCEIFSRGGYSPTKLFATLLLMTHTSLTTTCVEILGILELGKLSGELEYGWPSDPNVAYFSPRRIPLVIIAILLLLFYIIPAPLLLIFPTCGRNMRVFQRLTPIYDAFWAPFKPRYRFWVGLRLLLRGLPLGFAYFLSHPSNVLFLGVFLLIFTYVQVMVWPFKTTLLNGVDLFFQYNVLMLVLLTLDYSIYITDASDQLVDRFTKIQFVTFAVIVFIAYALIVAMFLWHIFVRFPKLQKLLRKLWERMCCRLQFRSKSGSISLSFTRRSSTRTYGTINEGEPESRDDSDEEESRQKVQFSELREPLLEEGELSIEPVTPGKPT